MSRKDLDPSGWEGPGADGVRPPVAGSTHYSSGTATWRESAAPGFWVKPLYSDTTRGESTMLMKVDPGAYAPLHTHDGAFEQVFVIEGTFYDQHRTMTAGDYCCRTPDAPHLSGSKDGALLMVIYTRREPAVRNDVPAKTDG